MFILKSKSWLLPKFESKHGFYCHFLDEERREREFNRKMKKMKEDSDVMSDRDSPVHNNNNNTTYRTAMSYNNYHRDEPQICVCLECCR